MGEGERRRIERRSPKRERNPLDCDTRVISNSIVVLVLFSLHLFDVSETQINFWLQIPIETGCEMCVVRVCVCVCLCDDQGDTHTHLQARRTPEEERTTIAYEKDVFLDE